MYENWHRGKTLSIQQFNAALKMQFSVRLFVVGNFFSGCLYLFLLNSVYICALFYAFLLLFLLCVVFVINELKVVCIFFFLL